MTTAQAQPIKELNDALRAGQAGNHRHVLLGLFGIGIAATPLGVCRPTNAPRHATRLIRPQGGGRYPSCKKLSAGDGARGGDVWHFLRRGQSFPEALTTLEDLLVRLGNVPGQLSRDPAVAASVYMRWVEDAEHRLPFHYEGDSVVGALHSVRYWHIRAIDAATARPAPLIEAEVEARQRALGSVRDQLTHYRDLLQPEAAELFVVPDTNVLVHGQLFTDLDWTTLVGSRTATLLLPLAVLDELDNLKNRGIGGAGAVLRKIDGLVVSGQALSRMSVRANVGLQLLDEPLGHTRLQITDDEIVRQSLYFASLCAGRLTIVTSDRGMRVRAEAAGLPVVMLPRQLARTRAKDASVNE